MYWLNLFTGTTWHEFQTSNSKVSGFREHHRSVPARSRWATSSSATSLA